MKRQKDEEIDILKEVYQTQKINGNIIKNETPDFIIIDKEKNLKIGIEITTLYDNELGPISSDEKFAKKFIANHRPDLKKKNKKNKRFKNMWVAKIEKNPYISGSVNTDYTIVQSNDFGDFLDFFDKTINRKSEHYHENPKGLEFVNLIIKNKGGLLSNPKLDMTLFYNFIRKHGLLKTIINSNFQEIYFISKFKMGKLLIPLKWFVFFSEFLIFSKFWKQADFVKESMKSNLNDKINNFIIILLHLGFNNIYLYKEDEFKYIMFGNKYIKFHPHENTLKEVTFFTVELTKLKKAENHFNYKDYYFLFIKYNEFRNKVSPKFKDEDFIKLD
ncbi:hypothetical protein [Aestuariibaculum marinum]|uniref:Uncharacterized protein n=1 Tax=Aestuariibaculum marinum TaxID=2683592 RepID=A0A8J6U474_9FLAO|nr:hypothetical protein [Aestuariibaculum marinum]MBD0822659.1 hypothetical protein [Aestuariibaculum marinum]